MSESETVEMVCPTTGMIIGQRAACTALGWSKPTLLARIREGIIHPGPPQRGCGQNHCFYVRELLPFVGDRGLNPIPASRYRPDAEAPAAAESRAPLPRIPAAAAGTHTPLPGDAAAGSDPHRQPPLSRAYVPAEAEAYAQPDEMIVSEIVLTQTYRGADGVIREEIRHLGDLHSAFDFALRNPGRYAAKRIEPESGAAALIREIDTGAGDVIPPSVAGSQPAAVPSASSPYLQNPGALEIAPTATLPAPPPPSSTDKMLELLVTYFLKQTGDVAAKMDPSQTAAQFIEMWREGRESVAEVAEDVAGPLAGDTNIFDVLIAGMDHVGPNIGEILSLALMRGGDNGSEPATAGDPASARQIDRPAAA